jgi:hypothetical protein
VLRIESGGAAERDVLAGWGETVPGRPLLAPVMKDGRRPEATGQTLEQIRARAAQEIARLLERLRGLESAELPSRRRSARASAPKQNGPARASGTLDYRSRVV